MGKIILLVFVLALVVVGGTMQSIVQPKSPLAAPFRGIAVGTLEITNDVASVFVTSSQVASRAELKVIREALQIMKASEDVDEVPVVDEPVNDMGQFPSSVHPLYPSYIEKRYTEFKYTVDEAGVVDVDTSDHSASTLPDRIQKKLEELKALAEAGSVNLEESIR